MRRWTSLVLSSAIFFAPTARSWADTPPAAVGGGAATEAPTQAETKMKRNKKGMLAWGGVFLLNSIVLTIGLQDLSSNRDAGLEAESRGEDPATYWDSYDRAGWLVAVAGAGLVLSGAAFANSLQPRPVTISEPPPPAPEDSKWEIKWPDVIEPPAPPVAPETPVIASVSPPADPVSEILDDLARKKGEAPPADRPAPVLTQTTRTQQAWLPGNGPPPEGAPATDEAAAETVDAEIEAPVSAEKDVPAVAEENSPAIADESVPVAGEVDAADEIDTPDAPATTDVTDNVDPEPAGEARTAPPPAPVVAAPQAGPSKETVRAAPATVSAPKSSGFGIHIASHKSRTHAQTEAARWAEIGYPVDIVSKDLGEKGIWFRLILGEFSKRAEAKAFLEAFQRDFPGQYAVVVNR